MDIFELVESIARTGLHDGDKHLPIANSQTNHRIQLVDFWGIKEGENVLELGCGQGDCTVVLASAVGPNGHVTAIDPGLPDYGENVPAVRPRRMASKLLTTFSLEGSPWTLQEAQSHISKSELGGRITWIHADPIAHLTANQDAKYDVAVLAHCIWYFASPSILKNTLAVLSTRVKRICIAEWALTSANPSTLPHILSVLAQASLECRKSNSESNVRTVLSPRAIKSLAEEVEGMRMEKEQTIVPDAALDDGKWEVAVVRPTSFVDEVEKHVEDERERSVVLAIRDGMLGALDAMGGDKVRAMDVWVACFKCQASF